jgi:hypothetical protein
MKTNSTKSLSETKNPKIIESIKKIFNQDNKGDYWNELSTNQKNEIDAASLEIKIGEMTDYDVFMEKHR